jgi:N,N'-diacetyllegionaminate synthase
MNRTLIIAEAGVNHNGDIELAKRLIEVAAAAGADFVKFQTFKAAKLASATANLAEYQKSTLAAQSDSQLQMLRNLELDRSKHVLLMEHARRNGISFLSAPFDLESADLLNELGVTHFKIPSGEITNLQMLQKIGAFSGTVILSTGMAELEEIGQALTILEKAGTPKERITVLHCNTQYPTPMADVNLKAMATIAKAFSVKVGYSDHTLGIEIPIAAVALGAVVIEKHFTVDRTLPGPDHKASLEPEELNRMVTSIRNIELALGSGIKRPSDSERANISVARKSIHLAVAKEAAEVIGASDLIMLRPGDGISPMEYEGILGKKTTRRLQAGHKLDRNDFE